MRAVGSGTGGCGSGALEAGSANDGGRRSAMAPKARGATAGDRPLRECCHGQGGSSRRQIEVGSGIAAEV